MKTELLSPSGNYECAKAALYNGADAIYLAYSRFGARAYAQNFTLEEIESITKIAHVLDKKVYVVINTLIKETELDDCFKLIDELYLINVDALIVTDIAIYSYLLDVYPDMECHISTQVGVKNLFDAKFFESLGATRVVLARETSLDDIINIKKNSKIQLEVFIHGALCVSYSGGCLMSSMLSLRSGNRGRCSQNCRREYTLYQDGNKVSDKCYLLSMKDLNSSDLIKKLKENKIDSLKIEGRMKNETYVKTITRHYRSLLDGGNGFKDEISQIFHRKYTEGFLGNTDRSKVTDVNSPANEGRKIGKVISFKNDIITFNAFDTVSIGDRIRFNGDNPQYLTLDNLMKSDNTQITNGSGMLKTKVNFKLTNLDMIYKMIDVNLDSNIYDENIIELGIIVDGKLGSKLNVTFFYDNNYFTCESDSVLVKSENKPLTEDSLFNQLSKLGGTPFYLDYNNYSCAIDNNLFLSVKDINEIRRHLVEDIYASKNNKRISKIDKSIKFKETSYEDHPFELIATCHTDAQYKVLKEEGINIIFYDNISSYTDKIYKDIKSNSLLVSNYGGLLKYKGKDITTNFQFNVMNSIAIRKIMDFGAKHVTLSYEMSKEEISLVSTSFMERFKFMAPLDIVIYGHQTLMNLEYCPIKAFNMCGKCKDSHFTIKDEVGEFHLIHDGCVTRVLNGNALNLIGEIDGLKDYVERFRLDFTIESEEETRRIIKLAKEGFKGDKVSLGKNETRGYYNRPVF